MIPAIPGRTTARGGFVESPMHKLEPFAVCCTLAVVALAGTAPVWSQSYPTRPVRMIVPFAPGGGSDVTGRIVAQKLTEYIGQSVVVDNRPGAAALIGTEISMRAAPDGYTLLLADSSFNINVLYYTKAAKYQPLRDFVPITLVAETPYLLVVHPGVPFAGGLKELIAYAKANPGKINVGSAGNGSGSHLIGELFKLGAGVNLNHVPYKGTGPATADVIAGQIQATFTTAPPAVQLLKAGRMKAIAQATAKRSGVLPDVPTFNELGTSGIEVTNWYGVVGVAGTPKALVDRLNAELVKVVAAPDVREKLAQSALEPSGAGPDPFRKLIETELARWTRVIKEAGIRTE